jgi:predicted dehydrogenase
MKIGVVGTGSVAQKNYIPCLAKIDDVELIYLNRTRAKAEACAEQFGGRAAQSAADLMEDDPDAVLVLTGERERYEAALELLDYNPRRLFFEKPLVADRGQAHVGEEDFAHGADLLARANAAGTETAMVFNYRFFDQTRRAMRLIAERGLGEVIQITGLVNYCCWSHCIDLIHHVAGPVATLTALAGATVRKGAGNEAVDVTAAFVTQSGAVGTLIGTAGTGFTFPLYEMMVACENGRFTWRGLDGDLELLDNGTGVHEVFALSRGTSRWDQYNASFGKSVGAYIDSIRKNAPPPVPGVTGLLELQFEAALRRSIRTGEPVDVQAEFPVVGDR